MQQFALVGSEIIYILCWTTILFMLIFIFILPKDTYTQKINKYDPNKEDLSEHQQIKMAKDEVVKLIYFYNKQQKFS